MPRSAMGRALPHARQVGCAAPSTSLGWFLQPRTGHAARKHACARKLTAEGPGGGGPVGTGGARPACRREHRSLPEVWAGRALLVAERRRDEVSNLDAEIDVLRGALKAALWAHDKSEGLYSMQDVLGL